MGFSDPPGVFFRVALFVGAIAAAAWALREIVAWEGITVIAWGATALASVALLLTQTATSDMETYGPVTCPSCDAPQSLYPWSL